MTEQRPNDDITTDQADPSSEPAAGTTVDAQASAGSDEHAAAWKEVIAQLDALGEAMGRWARAAVNDPENRERATEIKEHMQKMADSVGDAVDDAADSDVGQAFKDAAAKTGAAFKTAGDRVSEEVAPRVSSAFRTAAEKLHQAAERIEGSSPSPTPPTPPADAPDEQ